ncbi:MAG: WXG100 family type VII secretion target [Lachnospiraceae bacterium]|nr:WXG100 family type VII secretion target [Lachnospiraceae bacterium]
MAEIFVTPGELRSKAAELRELNAQFKTNVEELTATEGSLSSMWEGQAHDAFRSAFETDKGQWETFHTTIENYCITLENIATEYENAENKNAETASTRTYR